MIGLGIGTKNGKGEWLEVYYPFAGAEGEGELADCFGEEIPAGADHVEFKEGIPERFVGRLAALSGPGAAEAFKVAGAMKKSRKPCVAFHTPEDLPLASVPGCYFKLQCISRRLFKPNQLNLEGIFPLLPNVAWTSMGAVDPGELPDFILKHRLENRYVSVDSVDKFPKMTDYVVPKGVRIADTARVRLGAYVGEGTTVMHEGFINFNAGTAGKGMIEGRISNRVFVGNDSDLGGGCSTMGTLSGGGNEVISVGENCLIGANAGLGISLGDRCTIESGLYLTAGSKVQVLDRQGRQAEIVKARNLRGQSDLLFRRNSINGCVECLTNKTSIQLNEELHNFN